jgi:hypothetical protein
VTQPTIPLYRTGIDQNFHVVDHGIAGASIDVGHQSPDPSEAPTIFHVLSVFARLAIRRPVGQRQQQQPRTILKFIAVERSGEVFN